ncbi:MAG: rod shape-determining protein MreC, partial [Patescibacteria group bacterium]|nr:rod shape-determining protein MreC [Patescibacteria group bacterium]
MKSLLKNRLFFYVAIILIAVGFIFVSKKAVDKGEGAVFFVMKPFFGAFSSTGYWFQDKIDFVSSIGSLKKENEKLFNENLKMQSKFADLKEVELENKNLREQLDLAPRDKFELETALIIGKDLDQSNEIVYLNKGEKNGIKVGMPVVVNEGILVGKISKVFGGTSELELILDQKIKINAEIQELQAKGIVHGEYGTSVVMDMIPQTVEINSGDAVITSGLGNSMPRGILIGYIKDLSPTADKLFQKASISLPVSFEKIRV